MFAHIVTNIDDDQFLKQQWEALVKDSFDCYQIVKINLSDIVTNKIDWESILVNGRSIKQLAIIQTDIPLHRVPYSILEKITMQTIFIGKDGFMSSM